MSDNVYTHSRQTELFLPMPDANGILSDRLAECVELFNASIDPCERVELHDEIARIRRILQPTTRKAGR